MYAPFINTKLIPSLLQTLPINKVINISKTCPRSDLIPNDERHFLRIPVNDTYDAKLSPFFQQAYEFIGERFFFCAVLLRNLGKEKKTVAKSAVFFRRSTSHAIDGLFSRASVRLV